MKAPAYKEMRAFVFESGSTVKFYQAEVTGLWCGIAVIRGKGHLSNIDFTETTFGASPLEVTRLLRRKIAERINPAIKKVNERIIFDRDTPAVDISPDGKVTVKAGILKAEFNLLDALTKLASKI